VTLASGINQDRCHAMNLGYLDPATVRPENWQGRDDSLIVANTGEVLYQLKSSSNENPSRRTSA
jgi:hypothetical protein